MSEHLPGLGAASRVLVDLFFGGCDDYRTPMSVSSKLFHERLLVALPHFMLFETFILIVLISVSFFLLCLDFHGFTWITPAHFLNPVLQGKLFSFPFFSSSLPPLCSLGSQHL